MPGSCLHEVSWAMLVLISSVFLISVLPDVQGPKIVFQLEDQLYCYQWKRSHIFYFCYVLQICHSMIITLSLNCTLFDTCLTKIFSMACWQSQHEYNYFREMTWVEEEALSIQRDPSPTHGNRRHIQGRNLWLFHLEIVTGDSWEARDTCTMQKIMEVIIDYFPKHAYV